MKSKRTLRRRYTRWIAPVLVVGGLLACLWLSLGTFLGLPDLEKYEDYVARRDPAIVCVALPGGGASSWLVDAVVATEDPDFYRPNRASPNAMARAVWYVFNSEGGADGVSIPATFAAQLSRAAGEPSTTTRDVRLRRLALAWKLDRDYAPDELMTLYLNAVERPPDLCGVEAIALHYYDKSAGDLSLSESTVLLALIQLPFLDPVVDFEALRARQEVILARMVDEGYVTPEAAAEALEEALNFVER